MSDIRSFSGHQVEDKEIIVVAGLYNQIQICMLRV